MPQLEKIKQLKVKVEHCLATYPHTRDNDAQLTFCVIYVYLPNEIKIIDGKNYISTEALKAVREDQVKRIRARFNARGQYLSNDPEVRKQRKISEEAWRKFLDYNPEMRTV